MNLRTSFMIKAFPQNVEGGINGFAKLIKRAGVTMCHRPFYFQGFFDGFSTPSNVAHLAIEKEQSWESKKYTKGEIAGNKGEVNKLMSIDECVCNASVDSNAVCGVVKNNKDSRSGFLVAGISINEDGARVNLRPIFNFPNTSIQQFLTVCHA